MNPDLNSLQPYPFEKLRALLDGVTANPDLAPIALSVGEPQHPTPKIILDALTAAQQGVGKYPLTKGELTLREAIAEWLAKRFDLRDISAENQVLPVCGTREALFSFTQAAATRGIGGVAIMCNPCYQIYEGASLLAGLAPQYLSARDETGQPQFDEIDDAVWEKCQLLFLCTPDNPTGTVLTEATLEKALELAERFDFTIVSDECYSEIYLDEAKPPPGLLQIAATKGNQTFERCVIFHSLSKRSNAPGLRSGFVAGNQSLLSDYFRYRTYHGAAMSPMIQAASTVAWQDESHVQENRRQYRAKFAAVTPLLESKLSFSEPVASFYLWAGTGIDDQEFVRRLYEERNVLLVPGSYLSRRCGEIDPGKNQCRISLVAPLQQTIEAAERIADFSSQL